jgi:hypothetical protein
MKFLPIALGQRDRVMKGAGTVYAAHGELSGPTNVFAREQY